MLIQSPEQIIELRKLIFTNAEKAKEKLILHTSNSSALQLFAAIKFDKIGFDPLNGTELNLIEQLNQMYSDLVVLSAVERLLSYHRDKTFELHMGPTAGYDIVSTDQEVIAECFAVTSADSNGKLTKDCKKLLQSNTPYKYLFFYARRDSMELLQRRFAKYPEIHFERIIDFA